MRNDHESERNLARTITDAVNGSFNFNAFCEEMSLEHRTLQQNFMRDIVVPWINYAASEDYKKYCTDARNEATHELAKNLKEVLDHSNGLPYI